MSNNKKKLTIAYANKVKYEKLEEFQDSIFAEVYDSACRFTKKILEDNESLADSIPDPEYSSDEQLSNIVPFLGGRGMGKSSAMLSFALFLKSYEARGQKAFVVHTKKTHPTFSVLPRIDVAMLIKGENIMDIVLAKMWDAFEKRSEITYKREMYLEELKDDFKKVKRSYEIYKKTLAEKEIIQNMTSIREIHELAACLNLREDFKKLVTDYLGYVLKDRSCRDEDRFLVISIDDLDMAMGDVYGILEQIRLFLVIPKVIVLVTADIERLTMACNKQFTEKLISKSNAEQQEYRRVREYVTNYLAKLFPDNMRVFMPELGTLAGIEYEIIMEKQYLDKIYSSYPKGQESLDDKKLTLILMAKYSNIMYPPSQGKRYFWQKDTLRKIVNNLHMLLSISEQDSSEWFSLICRWYFIELSECSKNLEYGKGVNHSKIREQAQQLLRVKDIDFNDAVWNVLQQLNRFKNPGRGDYGNILAALDAIGSQEKVYHFLALLYSVQIAHMLNDDSNGIGTLSYCQSNIFHSVFDKYNNIVERHGLEKKRSVGNMLDMQLFYTPNEQDVDIVQLMKDNQQTLIEIFRISFLCGVNVWQPEQKGFLEWQISEVGETGATKDINTEKVTVEETDLAQSHIAVTVLNRLHKVLISLDTVFLRALDYEACARGFCQQLYSNLLAYFQVEEAEKQVQAAVEEILSERIWKLEEYRQWRSHNKVNNVCDLLPLQSVELMCWLARNMATLSYKDRLRISVQGQTASLIERRLQYLVQALHDVEQYYAYEEFGYSKYSHIISEYLEIVQVTNLSEENKRRLDLPQSDPLTFRPEIF